MANKWVLLLGVALLIGIVQCQNEESAKDRCNRPEKFNKGSLNAYVRCLKLLVNSRYRKRFDPSEPISYDVIPKRAYNDYQAQPNEDYDQSDIYYNYY